MHEMNIGNSSSTKTFNLNTSGKKEVKEDPECSITVSPIKHFGKIEDELESVFKERVTTPAFCNTIQKKVSNESFDEKKPFARKQSDVDAKVKATYSKAY